MCTETNLEKLQDLTPRLKDLVVNSNEESYQIYEVEDGLAFGFGLMNEPRVAVQRVYLPAGTRFTRHHHDVNEYIVCYEGELEIIANGNARRLRTGDCAFHPAGQTHERISIENSWIICVTIPADEGYSDAPRKTKRN